ALPIWALEQGYQRIKVKSRNQFPAMLRLLIRNNYLIEEYEKKDQILESRIHFVKSIKK
ncbi:GNAT family N-acetyltransferase, partial [Vibrio metoecus]